MTRPERARRAFEGHDAYSVDDDGFALESGRFDARVRASETDEWEIAYTVTVRAPLLDAVTAEPVGPAVQEGWLETFSLRLEDAPGTLRREVTVDVAVEAVDDEAVVRFTFEEGNADRAPKMAKTLAEYVEGTYMEGIVPGYSYQPPVSEMLSRARTDDEEGGRGSMPL